MALSPGQWLLMAAPRELSEFGHLSETAQDSDVTMGRALVLESASLEQESSICQLLVMRLWASYVSCPGLSFCICKMGVITVH